MCVCAGGTQTELGVVSRAHPPKHFDCFAVELGNADHEIGARVRRRDLVRERRVCRAGV